MKRNILYIFVGILAITIMGLVIGIFMKDDTSDNLEVVKVAEVTHSIFYAPFYVAIENGYFEDEGIKIDLMLVSGSDNVAASVLSGDTNVGLAGPESAVYVYLGKEKNYLQVFSGLTKRDGQFILSRKDEKFNWESLYGKEILVGRSTGMPALSFLRALENKGIDKNKVNINYSIEFAELSGSFIGGDGDYVNLFEPLASKLEDNKNGYVVESVGQASGEFPYTAFYARKNYINDNKDLLTRFTNAIKKGMDYTLNNDGNVVAKAIAKQFSDTKIDDLATMIDRYKESDAWLNTPYVKEEFYNTLVLLLKENNLINETVYYKDLVNNLYE
ncbi:MAG: ABC transporter substrate-binding protein [Bacilli bacterium]|nr:ABC transporter substrate-binding protein [Bacilli bacterium]MBQ8902129.1 ABC transporter substrate-binding protein [Bacilli bacterium]